MPALSSSEGFSLATNADETYQACHPELALDAGDPRYVDLNAARGTRDLVEIIARRITRTTRPHYHKQLVTGHRGNGKTTELKQLQRSLSDHGLFSAYLDVETLLDPGDIEYVDVLVAIAEGVQDALEEAGVPLPEHLLRDIDEWFGTRILTKEHRQDVEAAAEAKVGLPFAFLASLRSTLKVGGSRRTEVRRELQRKVPELLDRLNALLREADALLQGRGHSGLVVIVDGLEKMTFREMAGGMDSHRVFFMEHAEHLKAPECHIIYTVPVSLVFGANLGDVFVQHDVIPMVRTATQGGGAYPEGRAALRQVLASRVDLGEVFESDEAVNEIVNVSGGSVRDLLKVARMACDRVQTDEMIGVEHARAAAVQLEASYDYLVL